MTRLGASSTCLLALALGAVTALPASTGFCGDNDPATPAPECVSTATGDPVACSDASAVRVWPDDLRPGRPAQQIPAWRDSTQWRSFNDPDAINGHELFLALDVEDDYLYVAYNVGIQVWDISGGNADNPRRERAFDLYRGDFMSFIPDGENDFWIDDVAAVNLANDGSDSVLLALTGKDGVGFSIWEHTKEFDALEQFYQDLGTDTRTVELLEIGNTAYAFAGSFTGVHVYDLAAARDLAAPCLDDQGSVCPGVYLGKVGTLENGFYVSVIEQGGRRFVAASTGGNGVDDLLEIWEITDPTDPASANLVYRSSQRDVRATELFRYQNNTYLAINERAGTGRNLSIYRVTSCLANGGCGSLGTPVWRTATTSWPGNISWLTFSESIGRPFLYYGLQTENIEGGAAEQLFDLTTLGSTNQIVEITASGGTYVDPCNGLGVDYWGTYYPQNHNGLRNISPQAGRFNGRYFYRAAFGLLDVHVRQETTPPSEIFADGFESGDLSAWSTGGTG